MDHLEINGQTSTSLFDDEIESLDHPEDKVPLTTIHNAILTEDEDQVFSRGWLFAGQGATHNVTDLDPDDVNNAVVEEEIDIPKTFSTELRGRLKRTISTTLNKISSFRDGTPMFEIVEPVPSPPPPSAAHEHKKLGAVLATSICANDITSSCLYVAALCALQASVLAPISLLIVSLLLYLFRSIYGEVVTALPLNGGAYNVLLNTSSKQVASLAACLTLLSYVATAVVSATSGMKYLADLVNASWFNVGIAVIILLGIFCILNLIGISESAVAAFIIFAIHLLTLSVLTVTCFVYVVKDEFKVYKSNFTEHFRWEAVPGDIFFGFCAALLGISGFETSANFVEEQKRGVFVQTLRNMWLVVTFFNPLFGFLAFGVLSYDTIVTDGQNALLSLMGKAAGGNWLYILVTVDATLVLSGAVLTSYVGVTGLVRRMSMDRCLPSFLVSELPLTKTAYPTIIGFFAVCSLLYYIVDGKMDALSSVYTLAFLSVMSLFALGNMFLKYKRGLMPRQVVAPWSFVVIALAATLSGLAGNIYLDPLAVGYFLIYFSVALTVVMGMLYRVALLKILYFFISRTRKLPLLRHMTTPTLQFIKGAIQRIQSKRIIFFVSDGKIAKLNKALLYIKDNEQTDEVLMIHCYQSQTEIPRNLEETVHFLDEAYPKIRIHLYLVKGRFSPLLVHRISKRLNVEPNMMFIACPNNRFPLELSELGGVRLITH